MAEQNDEKQQGKVFKTGIKLIIGAVLIILGLAAVIGWWPSLWMVFKGCVGLFLIMAGAITIAIAKE
ncbi:MAG: hypothetical protein PHU64_00095 [Candidatus Omnitrophica bacterium]|nr:hypothetical protein [Candidatus Omnitrophota bacterium]MDD5430276.1 hypothetical protein [Candidatus Omnitrophota bacterium]